MARHAPHIYSLMKPVDAAANEDGRVGSERLGDASDDIDKAQRGIGNGQAGDGEAGAAIGGSGSPAPLGTWRSRGLAMHAEEAALSTRWHSNTCLIDSLHLHHDGIQSLFLHGVAPPPVASQLHPTGGVLLSLSLRRRMYLRLPCTYLPEAIRSSCAQVARSSPPLPTRA